MAPHKTVTINGRLYDAVTGLPVESVTVTNPDKTPIKKKAVEAPAAAKKTASVSSRGRTSTDVIESSTQRSKTLARRIAKKPAAPNRPITKRQAPGKHMDIARSTRVAKFAANPITAEKTATPAAKATTTKPAPKPVVAPAKTTLKTKPAATSTPPKPASKPVKRPETADRPAQTHPLAKRALARSTTKKKEAAVVKPASAKEVKDAQIAKALAPTPKPKKTRKRIMKDHPALRRSFVAGIIILIVALGLFAAWRLIPTISVSVAAAQAGISATYPEYTPDGYSLSQPVTFSEGEVDLKFTSHSNDNYYTITQTRSSWDSSAVLDNVVTPVVGQDYTTTKERGLTIYTYDNSAAWVNGGILYKVDSKAPLSGDQIRKIATSL